MDLRGGSNIRLQKLRIEESHYLLNLVFTIPECLQNSTKWSLPVKHTFYFCT